MIAETKGGNMNTKSLNIEGMSCHHCVMALRKSFEMIDGVDDAEVEVGKANVSFDETKVDDGKLFEAVVRAGFKVRDY
jgi:copper chaperone